VWKARRKTGFLLFGEVPRFLDHHPAGDLAEANPVTVAFAPAADR
jgi:hypothetical protein